MREIYNDIGIAEVLINNHTARTKLSIEEIDFVRTMLEKKNKRKEKYLTKKIDRLSKEILSQEKMLVELKTKHQVAVQTLDNLQSKSVVKVEDALPVKDDTDPNIEIVSNNIQS